MDKGKVSRVESVIEIVVVVVNLDWGELSFVDDVGGGKGADVEAFSDTPEISLSLTYTHILWVACLRRT